MLSSLDVTNLRLQPLTSLMMMFALITFNSHGGLAPMIQSLCSSNPWEFESRRLRHNRTDNIRINSPSLWLTEPRLHVRSIKTTWNALISTKTLCTERFFDTSISVEPLYGVSWSKSELLNVLHLAHTQCWPIKSTFASFYCTSPSHVKTSSLFFKNLRGL